MNEIRLKIEISTDSVEEKDLYHRDWIGMLSIDDCLLNENYAIDYIDLAKSAIAGGDYYILTCGCGYPGCARLDEPIKVTHEADRICWHITDPRPERRFEFSRVAYSASILDFLRQAQAEVPRPENEDEFPFGYYGFHPHHLDWCVRTLESGLIVGTGYEDPI